MAVKSLPVVAPEVESPVTPPWASTGRVLSVLEEIARRANSGQEPQDVLQRVVSSIVQHGPWDICWAGLVNRHTDRFSVYADAGFADHNPPLPFEKWTVSRTVSQEALQSGAPFVVPDALLADGYPLLQEDAGIREFRSVLIIPLSLGQETGVIWFCTREPRPFAEDEIAFAEVVGSLTSVAISNAEYERRQRSLLQQERRQSQQLRRLNALAEQQYRDLERLSQTHSAFLHELVSEGGISGLAAVVFKALNSGVSVVDRFGNLLTAHGDDPPLSESEAEVIAQVMKGCKGLDIEDVELADRCVTAIPIDSGDTRMGYICCAVEVRTLDPIVKDLLSQASLHMTLEMIKDRIRLESYTRLFGNFVAALSSEREDLGSLERAATAVGLALNRPIRVFRCKLEHDGKIEDLLLFAKHLQRLMGDPFEECVIVPAGDQDLLILVQWPSEELEATVFTYQLRRSLDRVCRMVGGAGGPAPIKITVGMGSIAVGPAELREAEKEARQSLEVAKTMGVSGTDVDLQSLGVYSLLTTMEPSRAADFVLKYLGAVQDYDRQHNSQLCATIAAYVDTGGSIVAASRELHIHVSTLKYRLGRVRELTGMSLSSPEHYLCFALACRLQRLENDLLRS